MCGMDQKMLKTAVCHREMKIRGQLESNVGSKCLKPVDVFVPCLAEDSWISAARPGESIWKVMNPIHRQKFGTLPISRLALCTISTRGRLRGPGPWVSRLKSHDEFGLVKAG